MKMIVEYITTTPIGQILLMGLYGVILVMFGYIIFNLGKSVYQYLTH